MDRLLKSIFDYVPASLQKKREQKDAERDSMLVQLAPGEPSTFNDAIDEGDVTYRRGPAGGGGKGGTMKNRGGSGGGGDIEDAFKPKSMFRKRVM